MLIVNLAFHATANAHSFRCINLFTTSFQKPAKGSIAELMDEDGNIVLFRVIGGTYQEGSIGSYSLKQQGYSYSLNPFVILDWGKTMIQESAKQVIIVSQNVGLDGLRYPSLAKLDELMNQAKGEVDLMSPKHYMPLIKETMVSDIAMMEEVQVPIGRENILKILDFETFHTMVSEDNQPKFNLKNFLKRLGL